jgi:hypothetical protein
VKTSRLGWAVILVLSISATVPARAGDPESIQTGDLTKEQKNLAYCAVVLSDKRFGGLRPGENDPASGQVLRDRLARQLDMPDAGLDVIIIPSTMVTVAVETEARGKPRFSATACAGYAHFIRTTPLP